MVTMIEQYLHKVPSKLMKFEPKSDTAHWFTFDVEHYILNGQLRSIFVNEGIYAFVSRKWTRPFAKWIGERKVLEVMAGRGMITHALRKEGVNIMGVDDFSWAKGHEKMASEHTFTTIQPMDAIKAVKKYGRSIDILIMSWAPYDNSAAFDVLKTLHEVNPDALVVSIDEGSGGCIADDQFFNYFQLVDDQSFEEIQRHYESWDSIYDLPKLGKYAV